jgi:hypothetical protein
MQSLRAVKAASVVAIATILAGADGLHAQAARGGPHLADVSRAAPLHRTSDFAWLAGSWEGRLVGADNIGTELTFQPPKGGLMSGVMRLSQDGKPVLLELISIIDGSDGVELRFRHFDGALSTMESTFKQTMLLTKSTDSSDTFENTVAFDKTLLSTQPRVASWTQRGQNAMVAHSDILDENGKPSTIEVVYRRITPHS